MFENIRSVQLEALLLSLLSIVVLVLVKELNEKFQRNIKVVLPIDLLLVSTKLYIRLFLIKLSVAQSAEVYCAVYSYPHPHLPLIKWTADFHGCKLIVRTGNSMAK